MRNTVFSAARPRKGIPFSTLPPSSYPSLLVVPPLFDYIVVSSSSYFFTMSSSEAEIDELESAHDGDITGMIQQTLWEVSGGT